MYGCEGRGTSSVSVVQNSEGPLLVGSQYTISRVVLIRSWNTAVVRRLAAFWGVCYGRLHCSSIVAVDVIYSGSSNNGHSEKPLYNEQFLY